MPNIKSAKKRVLVNDKKNERNRMLTNELRTAIKKINAAIETGDIETAEKLLPETMSIIDQAATKGVITSNSADNRKARISKKISDIKSGKKEIVVKKDNKTIAAEKRAEKLAKEEAARAEVRRLAEEKKAAKAAEEEAKKPRAKRAAAAKKTEKDEPEKAAKPKKSRAKKED